MESVVLYASVLAVITNGVLVSRRWPGKGDKDSSTRTLAILVDPLVTALVCPLASDLYFYLEWVSGCSATYTTIIMAISLLLYACSLVTSYRLVQLATPPSSSSTARNTTSQDLASSHSSLVPALCWSSACNSLLTWALLPVVQHLLELRDDFDSESCQTFFLKDMMLGIFITCLAPQLAYTGLHFCISKASVSERGDDFYSKFDDSFRTTSIRSLILYSTTALLCLVSTNILRFIFTTCSCEGLYLMSNSLHTVSLLLSLKLPCASLIQLLLPQGLGKKLLKLDP